jgi:hypothetical protein
VPRPRRLLPAIAAVALGIATAAGVFGVGSQSARAATAWPAHVFAPYVDTGLSNTTLTTVAADYGTKYFTLAFVNGSGCQWSLPQSGWQSQVSALQAEGGDVSISFGGYTVDTNGTDLGAQCSSASAMAGQVESVVTSFNVTHLDFDIESNEESNSSDLALTAQALNQVRSWGSANGRQLTISYTIPVLPTGLTSTSESVLTTAQANGFTPNIVNIMTMDYGTSTEMGTAANQALDATASQLESIYGISSSAGYGMLGNTPMIGQNDTSSEIFTLVDASTVESYAAQRGIALLSFWAEGRDNGGCPNAGYASSTCSGISQSNGAFTQAFQPFTSGGGTGGSEGPYGGTPTAIPGTVQAANYDTGGQGVAYNVASVNGTANSYRSDGIDLEACTDTGCGDDIGWTAAGQWFKYTVNVATAGTYTVSLRLASPNGVTDGLHIANSSGANLSGNINVPATGGWQTWTTVTATVTLPAGQQTLTINQDNGGWNIHQLTFASSSSANTVTVTSPGNQTGTVGTAASLQVSGTDSASGQTLAFTATGLPAGLSISSSGLISGTPTTAATSSVTVTATDTTGATGSASFTWAISSTAPPPSSLVNGGFETGSLSPWVCQAGDAVVTAPVHSGTYAAVITTSNSQTGECDQTITLSPNTTYTLTGWTQGSYAYIGVTGGATASTWTSTSGWTQQTLSFTTGSSGTVTVFVHGWYGQGNVYADDFSVT